MIKRFTYNEISTLINICRAAADKYDEDRKIFIKLASQEKDDPFVTRSGAVRMAEQFRQQQEEALRFANLLSTYPSITADISEDYKHYLKEVV